VPDRSHESAPRPLPPEALQPRRRPTAPNYGIDAPGVIWGLLASAFALLLLGRFFPRFTIGPVMFILIGATTYWAVFMFLGALAMIFYSRSGKFHQRDRMLAMINWRGDEQVLDVGAGRGLLLIGAAHKLTAGGKATGIDIWSAKDLSGNKPAAAIENAEIEGVRDRVQVETGDASAMQFSDATFDVVLSNFCLHNIPSREGRDRACREIVRVLKPGGKALICDFIRTSQYANVFREAGAEVHRTGWGFLLRWPQLRVVEVTKPPNR
jgi:SAM-dependent methyltransferase